LARKQIKTVFTLFFIEFIVALTITNAIPYAYQLMVLNIGCLFLASNKCD